MKILYDDNMPYAPQYFASILAAGSNAGWAKPFTAGAINDNDLLECEALLVRSTTKVDEALIAKAPALKYVATATAGFNHLDITLLEKANIAWYAAGGCNARAVAEYVISALLLLSERYDFNLADKTLAIVGVGNVGGTLSDLVSALGMRVIEYDPPRALREPDFVSASFEQVLSADIISLHVPLVVSGEHPSAHMFDAPTLAKLNSTQILINASRGEVVDNQALLHGFTERRTSMPKVCLDCWENEPTVARELIEHLDICTAHIAGHSLEGKARGTDMVYQDLCRFISLETEHQLTGFLPQYTFENTERLASLLNGAECENEGTTMQIVSSVIKCVYDIENDDSFFRSYMAKSPSFSAIRQNYPVRREWPAAQLTITHNKAAQVLKKLGFKLANDSKIK